jgi:hypothetical protein
LIIAFPSLFRDYMCFLILSATAWLWRPGKDRFKTWSKTKPCECHKSRWQRRNVLCWSRGRLMILEQVWFGVSSPTVNLKYREWSKSELTPKPVRSCCLLCRSCTGAWHKDAQTPL